jgi:hypothetical protein
MSDQFFSFDLPTDPDRKKIAAALLTNAMCSLLSSGKSEHAAAGLTYDIYEAVLDPTPEKTKQFQYKDALGTRKK